MNKEKEWELEANDTTVGIAIQQTITNVLLSNLQPTQLTRFAQCAKKAMCNSTVSK
jgi:hypothetical protein